MVLKNMSHDQQVWIEAIHIQDDIKEVFNGLSERL